VVDVHRSVQAKPLRTEGEDQAGAEPDPAVRGKGELTPDVDLTFQGTPGEEWGSEDEARDKDTGCGEVKRAESSDLGGCRHGLGSGSGSSGCGGRSPLLPKWKPAIPMPDHGPP